MASQDLKNEIKTETAIAPLTVTGNGVTTGLTIDTEAFQGFSSLTFAFTSGVITDGTLTASVEEAALADMSDAVVVGAAGLIGTLPVFLATDDAVSKRVGYRGDKRYVRVKLTQTGATTGGIIGCTAILGHPGAAPTPA